MQLQNHVVSVLNGSLFLPLLFFPCHYAVASLILHHTDLHWTYTFVARHSHSSSNCILHLSVLYEVLHIVDVCETISCLHDKFGLRSFGVSNMVCTVLKILANFE